MNSKNTPVSDTEKLPSDEQLRRTVDRVLGRSQAAASVTTYDAAGTAHHSDNSSSAHGNNSRRVLDTRAREISDVQREHSEYDAYLVVQKNLGSDSLQKWMDAQLGQLHPGEFEVSRYATSKGFRILQVHRYED